MLDECRFDGGTALTNYVQRLLAFKLGNLRIELRWWCFLLEVSDRFPNDLHLHTLCYSSMAARVSSVRTASSAHASLGADHAHTVGSLDTDASKRQTKSLLISRART